MKKSYREHKIKFRSFCAAQVGVCGKFRAVYFIGMSFHKH